MVSKERSRKWREVTIYKMTSLNLLTYIKISRELNWFYKEESRVSDIPLAWLGSQNTQNLLCNARLQL